MLAYGTVFLCSSLLTLNVAGVKSANMVLVFAVLCAFTLSLTLGIFADMHSELAATAASRRLSSACGTSSLGTFRETLGGVSC